MTVYRIADSRHSLFDGTGAFLNGGRWNSPGKRVIYTAATYGGALLEQLAHANTGRLPGTQAFIAIQIPETLNFERVLPEEIPGWNTADLSKTRERGDRWLRERKSPILIVPSAVTNGMESNVLLNPDHPEFARITASQPQPVQWDPRLKPR